MKLTVNGEDREFPGEMMLGEVMSRLEIKKEMVAAAVNRQVIHSNEVPNFKLEDGDHVELIQIVGGG